jgi:DNA (cytosine-5)-methyltransferase 1
MNFIDLFAGAGGLSEGFIRAGFSPIAHVEMDKSACNTILTRTTYHHLKGTSGFEHYLEYIQEKGITAEELYKLLPEEKRESVINLPIGKDYNQTIFEKIDALKGDKSIDLILGGPPCQAYSLVGRARDKNKMQGDPRNFLYKEYAKFLKKYTPRMFVFENVRGLITADEGSYFKNMQAYFKRIGYELDYSIQNAEDFGVLQKRRRIILIGWLKGSGLQYPNFSKVKGDYKISDILSDLKELKPGEQNNITKYRTESTEYLERFKIRNGIDFVTQHIARPHNDRDLEIYKIAIKKWLNHQERLKYPDLPQRLKTHKNEKSFADRFKVVDPNGYAHTMVAHIAKDGHHYIYPDVKQIRSLSVREAARIQSFPDDFFFEGGRGAAFRQIGNAVPPLMAEKIAKKIEQIL